MAVIQLPGGGEEIHPYHLYSLMKPSNGKNEIVGTQATVGHTKGRHGYSLGHSYSDTKVPQIFPRPYTMVQVGGSSLCILVTSVGEY